MSQLKQTQYYSQDASRGVHGTVAQNPDRRLELDKAERNEDMLQPLLQHTCMFIKASHSTDTSPEMSPFVSRLIDNSLLYAKRDRTQIWISLRVPICHCNPFQVRHFVFVTRRAVPLHLQSFSFVFVRESDSCISSGDPCQLPRHSEPAELSRTRPGAVE